MAILKGKQLSTRLSGSYVISGSSQALHGTTTIFGETTISGSSVTIETPKFFLGKKGSQFVSGSNNLLEISSSKFHLKNDGSVVVSGDITITGGDLAGVNTNTISGSADEVSSSLAGRQTPFETQVVLSSGGMSLNKDDGTSLAEYGTTTRIGESGEARVEISNSSVECPYVEL